MLKKDLFQPPHPGAPGRALPQAAFSAQQRFLKARREPEQGYASGLVSARGLARDKARIGALVQAGVKGPF